MVALLRGWINSKRNASVVTKSTQNIWGKGGLLQSLLMYGRICLLHILLVYRYQ